MMRNAMLTAMLVATVVSFSTAADADEAPATAKELFDALAALPGLSADYREEKYLTVLVDPVVSEGRVLLIPPSKLIRVTTKPIWSSLVATDNALSYRDAAGPQKVPAAKGDPARVFVEIFVDVARGNVSSLEKTFVVSFSRAKKAWKLELTPRKKDFGIKKIELAGAKMEIASMKIVDAAGDRTELTFTRIDSKRPSKAAVKKALKPPKR